MKLRTLIEKIDYTTQDHLVLEVNVDPIHEPGQWVEIYIISDIPRLSKEQFDELYKTSFTGAKPRHFLTIEQLDVNKPRKDSGGVGYPIRYLSDYTMKWKEFVKHMQTFFNPDYDDNPEYEDDFDE